MISSKETRTEVGIAPAFLRMTKDQIIELIAKGDLYPFYNGRQWRRLSHEIMTEQHHECQLCKERGRHRRARLIHHVNELKKRPDLAYERYYTDEHGTIRRNLIALCQDCHEAQHPDRLQKKTAAARFTNPEKW